jgi:putative FmdB family regulatory protein
MVFRFIDLTGFWQIKYVILRNEEEIMPIYEYICLTCSEKFSLLQSLSASQDDTNCPKCASKKVKKIISSFCCTAGTGGVASSSMPSGGFSGGG